MSVETKKEKHAKLTCDDLNNLLKLLINTNGRSLNDIPKEESDKLLEEQFCPLAVEGKIESPKDWLKALDSGKKISRTGFSLMSVLDPPRLKKFQIAFNSVVKDFEKELKLSTGLDISCDNVFYSGSVEKFDITQLFEADYSYNYFKTTYIDNYPFYISVSPDVVNTVLMDCNREELVSVMKKEIVNNFIINPLLKNINNHSVSKEFKNQTENCKKNIKEKPYAYFYCSFNINYNGQSGEVTVATSENTWLKFIEEGNKGYDSLPDFSSHNVFAVLSEFYLSEDIIKKFSVGNKISITTNNVDDIGEEISYVVNRKRIGTGFAVAVDSNYGIKIEKINESKTDFYENNRNNIYLILGSKHKSNEELNEIKEGYVEEFENNYANNFSLIYKDYVIAFCELYVENGCSFAEITKVLDKPVKINNK